MDGVEDLKELELIVKPSQRQEWIGEASLGRSRLEPGCRTNMHKLNHILV